jgi:hypothetical protein
MALRPGVREKAYPLGNALVIAAVPIRQTKALTSNFTILLERSFHSHFLGFQVRRYMPMLSAEKRG